MAISNYSELQASVANWLAKKNLGDKIPDFISIAERRIFRELRTPANERTLIYKRRVDDGDLLLIPSDYLELKTLKVNGVPLTRMTDREYDEQKHADDGGRTGQPTHFVRYANRFRVYPEPAADYEWVLSYWVDLTLTDAAPVNTILTIAPDIYLYGALAEAEAYLMNDKRVALWEAKFQDALHNLQEIQTEAEFSGSASITRSVS